MSPTGAFERTIALLEMHRPQDALEHVHAALAAAPDNPALHALAGHAYLHLGRHEEALRAGNAAVAHGPESEHGHNVRAVALVGLERGGEAKQAALNAVRLAPDDAYTHIVLANALHAARDHAGAVAAAEQAIALDPHDADTHAALGEILLEQDRPRDAIDAYTRALALNPEDADALNNQAVARLRTFQRDGVGEQFEAAARLDPRLREARENLIHTGPAGRSFAYRRWSVAFAVLAIVLAVNGTGEVILCLGLVAVLELLRSFELRGLSAPTRRLLADDRRARRCRPLRWDWAWPLRLHPWWWMLLAELLHGARRRRPRRASWRPPT